MFQALSGFPLTSHTHENVYKRCLKPLYNSSAQHSDCTQFLRIYHAAQLTKDFRRM